MKVEHNPLEIKDFWGCLDNTLTTHWSDPRIVFKDLNYVFDVARINTKAKGTKGERELVTFFNESGWSCIRSAGSGSTKYPSPDILAGNAVRRLAIECKVTKDKRKYFTNQEIEQLQLFSRQFGAESWVGVRFPAEPWYFLMLEDLKDTGKSWAVSLELAKLRGLTKEELIHNS